MSEIRENVSTLEYIAGVYQRCKQRKRLYERTLSGVSNSSDVQLCDTLSGVTETQMNDEYSTMAYQSDKETIAMVEETLHRCKPEHRTDVYLGYLSEYPNEKAKGNFAAVNEFVHLLKAI